MPEAQAFAFLPPAIPGIGQAAGVDFFVQDRAGKTVDYLWKNTQKFLAAASKRPELARMNLTFIPAVPQMFAAVDKDKVFKLGVSIEDVYGALQTLLGGYYVNQFNRFGRVWKVFVEAEPEYRTRAKDVGQFYVRNKSRRDGSAVDAGRHAARLRPRVHDAIQRVSRHRDIRRSRRAGYSTGDAMSAVTQVANQVLPRDMGTAWNGISLPAIGRGRRRASLRALADAGVPDPGRAVRELDAAVQRALSVPVAVCGAFFGLWSRRFRQRRLRADRSHHADRAIGKERDPDRRVRQGRARERRVDRDAALNGARSRLRPILMTSFAFIFGLMPLWTALGAGAAARRLIGTVTIVGMVFSSAFAIFLVPALFVIVERMARHRDARERPEATPAAAPELSTETEDAQMKRDAGASR